MLEAMESGVQGSLVHGQDLFGYLFDAFGDIPPMLGTVPKSPQDEEVEGPLEQVQAAFVLHDVDVLHYLV